MLLTSNVGLRALLRDHHGSIMLFAAKFLSRQIDIDIVEAITFCFGVDLALATGFQHLIVKSDSLKTIVALQDNSTA